MQLTISISLMHRALCKSDHASIAGAVIRVLGEPS